MLPNTGKFPGILYWSVCHIGTIILKFPFTVNPFFVNFLRNPPVIFQPLCDETTIKGHLPTLNFEKCKTSSESLDYDLHKSHKDHVGEYPNVFP